MRQNFREIKLENVGLKLRSVTYVRKAFWKENSELIVLRNDSRRVIFYICSFKHLEYYTKFSENEGIDNHTTFYDPGCIAEQDLHLQGLMECFGKLCGKKRKIKYSALCIEICRKKHSLYAVITQETNLHFRSFFNIK